jgi:F-type H+-transporting ATPase subunit a
MDIHVEIAAETLFHIGPFPFTNSFLMMLLVMTGIILFGRWVARSLQVIPGRRQGAVEMVVEFLLNLVEGTAGKRVGRRIFPLVSALFIFIIVANYSGLLPGVGTIGYYHAEEEDDEAGEEQVEAGAGTYEVAAVPAAANSAPGEDAGEDHGETHQVLVPWFRAPNADLNMTIAMALITFTVVQIAGITAHGVKGRIKHMADPPFMFPIELISEFSRIISLSARLFGNIFAGEVLLTVMFTLAATIRVAVVPFAIPVIFLGLELLFGFIQALVFALLTLIYITLATADSHGGDADHGHAEPAHPLRPAAAGAGD